ncbi:AAEL002521-PA [Aedes aegypti]|uniref:AAEL002521-PA n=2 Tax=Aedes aegypti TaxID=7159 RepID=Q16KN0_AEDAE|nr:Golgi to ER traffic protein 4 homolog [Aedes aegypti]EAT34855.1 AAEL012936-PA [Aedes aegypti]EAT46261.1 AAEL002521-PA [Aedes aegypti]
MATKATATGAVPGARGVARVLAKLESSIEAGNYYEAHQMYRTLYFRYLSQQKYEELLDLLYQGALTLLSHEQNTSGADLGLLLVDTLEKSKTVAEGAEKWMQKIALLLSKIPQNVVERETLLVKAVKWSASVSKSQVGHPLMHKLIAQIMWNEDNLAQARHHFLLSKDGSGCGHMLIQLSQTKGFPSEMDLFIAQVILQQLCLKETSTAAETFATYTKYHPKIACSEPPFITPLLNFIFFLLRAIEANQRKLIVFRTLCELYKPSLERDPSYEKYLQKIGMIFFEASQPQRPQSEGMGGIFGNLLNQLFQGLDDDLDDEPAGGSHPRMGSTGPTGSTPTVKEELD